MKLAQRIDQYDGVNVVFCESTKNNVVNDGTFLRLVYSTPTFALNGVHVYFPIVTTFTEKSYNKYKVTFDKQVHANIIEKLKMIEEDIIKRVGVEGKEAHYKITDQVRCGFLKLTMDHEMDQTPNVSCLVLLKISGVWETDTQYGVTYKFSLVGR